MPIFHFLTTANNTALKSLKLNDSVILTFNKQIHKMNILLKYHSCIITFSVLTKKRQVDLELCVHEQTAELHY